jgi:hydrogenase maturation protein HypF
MLAGPAIGVILDGHGFADDGSIWGGELLVGDCARARRVAHLRAVPQPGGDRAARESWRMAVAYLRETGEDTSRLIERRGRIAHQVAALCETAPRTSSAGRLFDAVASILGVCDESSYEGEAAMRLESLARAQTTLVTYPIEIVPAAPFAGGSTADLLDTLPVIRGVVRDQSRGVPAATIARRFHNTLVELLARACIAIARREAVRDVVLSGGVFANAILANELPARLRACGLVPHLQRRVPPNDGGLSFGQLAAVAAADRQVS